MTKRLLSTGTKGFAEASLFDPVWGLGLGADDAETSNALQWPGNTLHGKASLAVLDAIRTSRAGLADPASFHQFCTPTSPDEIHEISPAPCRPMALARACPGLPSELSTCFSDPPADNSPKVLAVAPGVDPSLARSERAPCLVGGITTLDDTSFAIKIAVHCEANALTLFG